MRRIFAFRGLIEMMELASNEFKEIKLEWLVLSLHYCMDMNSGRFCVLLNIYFYSKNTSV